MSTSPGARHQDSDYGRDYADHERFADGAIHVACGASLPFRLAAELDRRRDDPQAVMQLGVAHATAQSIELLQSGAPGCPLLHAESKYGDDAGADGTSNIGFVSKSAAQNVPA